MYNPQQNININISYNLSQNKQKLPPGKRITKIQKPSYSSGPCDIQIKLKSKMAEDLKKSTEHRLSNDNKKGSKKKGSSGVGRNTFTPDLFNDRRVRTQGPSAEHPDHLGTVKKVKPHSKSIQPAQQKVGISAKKIGTTKTTKSLKNGHVNSFILINPKKHPLELSQTTGIKKRRAQSQTSFARNDKVVSKLLNMSLLASELGGSRPITSQRRCLESHSKTFKEYLSSIDVRILKTMSDDVPIFTRRMNSHEEVVKAIMKSNQISLEELTRKVVVIQRAWKRAMKTLVIKKYRLLFQQATDKLVKEPSHQISAFAAQSIISDLFHPDSSEPKQLQYSTPLSQSQQSSNSNSLRNSSLHEKSNSYQLKWIQQNNKSQEQSQREKLNLTKYRELVMGQISRNKERRGNGNNPQPTGQQLQQWNNLNKKLNGLMNDRKQFDPSTLLDDFIEQSNYNKEWIQNEFQPSSRKQSQLNSEEKPLDNAEEPISSNQRFICQQKERNDEDSLDESQGYDHIKYGSPEEQHQILQKKMRELDRNRRRQRPHHQLSNLSESEGSQQKWINPSMMEDTVVKGYLDCGLDDFGLNLNHKIIAIDDKEGMNENQYNVSSDQAIGAKFQEANRGIVRKGHHQLDSQPATFKVSMKEKQADHIVQTTVENLISQFAIDISSILKKSTQAPPQPQPQRKPVQARPPGLATNFNSIKEYISKFLDFINKTEQNYSKILVNINKDIGPTSLEILSYLRPEDVPLGSNQSFSIDEEGLFVIPTDIFQQFQNQLQEQYKLEHQRQMGPRLRAYTNFWQRCIFESFNQCLDYERPYGIEGKPYDWVTETKIFRKVKRSDIKQRFKSAQNRLYQLTLMVGGIIFEKPDSPFANTDFSLQDRHRINQQRLSRILATQLLQSQQSWINYNDEMAELLVELARMIEDKVFFQFVAEMKRLQRRRKIIIEEIGNDGTIYNL